MEHSPPGRSAHSKRKLLPLILCSEKPGCAFQSDWEHSQVLSTAHNNYLRDSSQSISLTSSTLWMDKLVRPLIRDIKTSFQSSGSLKVPKLRPTLNQKLKTTWTFTLQVHSPKPRCSTDWLKDFLLIQSSSASGRSRESARTEMTFSGPSERFTALKTSHSLLMKNSKLSMEIQSLFSSWLTWQTILEVLQLQVATMMPAETWFNSWRTTKTRLMLLLKVTLK